MSRAERQLQEAAWAGRVARGAGKPASACPYRWLGDTFDLAEAWTNGWARRREAPARPARRARTVHAVKSSPVVEQGRPWAGDLYEGADISDPAGAFARLRGPAGEAAWLDRAPDGTLVAWLRDLDGVVYRYTDVDAWGIDCDHAGMKQVPRPAALEVKTARQWTGTPHHGTAPDLRAAHARLGRGTRWQAALVREPAGLVGWVFDRDGQVYRYDDVARWLSDVA